MKIRSFFTAVALLSFALSSRGNITDITYAADGDGAITCPLYTWPGGTDINIYGDQTWGPGHILFDVETDSSGDPTLTLGNAIDNDTTFAWTGYEVDVWMNKAFTISAPSVTLPPGWTVSSVVQPVGPVAGVYTGSMFFTSGTPVQIGDELDFTYAITFAGGAQFTEQLVPVPEPATFSLLAGGMLLIARRLGSKRR